MIQHRSPWYLRLLKKPHLLLVALALLAIIVFTAFLTFGNVLFAYNFSQAQSALDANRFDEAKGRIVYCLAHSPRDGRTHLLAARIARRSGDLKVADRQLKEAQKILNLTDDIVLERALLAAQKGEVDNVKLQLRPLVDKGHPRTVEILEALAKGYLRGYRFSEADKCINEWLEHDPDNAQAYYLLGWSMQQRALKGPTIEYLSKSADLEPTNLTTRFQLALAYIDNIQPEDAISHLEYVASRQPHNVEVLVHLARCQFALGKISEARENLEKVLKDNPKNMSALVEMGLLANNTQHPEEAEEVLNRALELDPNNLQANFAYIAVLQKLGKDAQYAEEAAKVDRLKHDIYNLQELLTKAIPGRPTDPVLHCEAGIVLLRMGSEQEGERMLFRSLKFNPQYEPAYKALMDHYEKVGKFKQASRLREAFETGSPIEAAYPDDSGT